MSSVTLSTESWVTLASGIMTLSTNMLGHIYVRCDPINSKLGHASIRYDDLVHKLARTH